MLPITPWFSTSSKLMGSVFQGLLEAQNHLDHGFVPSRRVEHGMIKRSVRPFLMEIPFNKGGPLTIDGIHQFFSLPLAHPAGPQAVDFLFGWGKEEDPQGVGAIP